MPLIISSDREGSPKVLYESLYCKVPVLSTCCGNIAEVLPNQSIAETNDQSFQHLLKNGQAKLMNLACCKRIVSMRLGAKTYFPYRPKK
jgi:hypothetical protein